MGCIASVMCVSCPNCLLTEYDPEVPTGNTPAPIPPPTVQQTPTPTQTPPPPQAIPPLPNFTNTLNNPTATTTSFVYPPLNVIPTVIPPRYGVPSQMQGAPPQQTQPPSSPPAPPKELEVKDTTAEADAADQEVENIDRTVCIHITTIITV